MSLREKLQKVAFCKRQIAQLFSTRSLPLTVLTVQSSDPVFVQEMSVVAGGILSWGHISECVK
jgi:hypothetical protein